MAVAVCGVTCDANCNGGDALEVAGGAGWWWMRWCGRESERDDCVKTELVD